LRGRRGMNRLHALRRLHGERRNRSDSIAVVRRKRLQIGGHTCATRRIESGNREKNWGSVVRMVIQNEVPSARGTKAGAAYFFKRAGKEKCTRVAPLHARRNFNHN
jgi:hypothetical protein